MHQHKAILRASLIVMWAVGLLGAPSACTPAGENQPALLQKWQNQFAIGQLPSEWERIPPESGEQCVLSWRKGDVRIHMYIYEWLDADAVLSDVSRGMYIHSEPRVENVSNFAMSVDGLAPQGIFVRYVAIPSETGRHTFSFAYMQRIPDPEIKTLTDLAQLIRDMPDLEDYQRFIADFRAGAYSQ